MEPDGVAAESLAGSSPDPYSDDGARSAPAAGSLPRDVLDQYAHRGLWALPGWAGLLLLATLSHQPSFQTDFPGYARYVTTPQFLLSHLVGSILGAGVGVLGLVALFVVLTRRGVPRLALVALVSSVLGTMLITSVFGVAAFAQPAIGQAYLAGQTDAAIAMNEGVYGPALVATALPGLLLFTLGIVLFGVAVTRAPDLPKLAGFGFALGGVAFAGLGFLLSNFVQPLGAALMLASTAWLARAVQRG